jgi:hypothetical protein
MELQETFEKKRVLRVCGGPRSYIWRFTKVLSVWAWPCNTAPEARVPLATPACGYGGHTARLGGGSIDRPDLCVLEIGIGHP